MSRNLNAAAAQFADAPKYKQRGSTLHLYDGIVMMWCPAPPGWRGRPLDLTRREDFEELFLGAGPAPGTEAGAVEEENEST